MWATTCWKWNVISWIPVLICIGLVEDTPGSEDAVLETVKFLLRYFTRQCTAVHTLCTTLHLLGSAQVHCTQSALQSTYWKSALYCAYSSLQLTVHILSSAVRKCYTYVPQHRFRYFQISSGLDFSHVLIFLPCLFTSFGWKHRHQILSLL